MSWHISSLMVLWLAVVGTALGVVASKHASRQQFLQLQKLEKARDDLIIEWGQLQLEQSTWATHGRVEQLARKKLKMKIPRVGDTVMVLP
ncbi:MAG TPA: cell division protein FtsL [Chromatiales bacterium]|nr:cell division protein FtsL [Thiotrichales bacterium]HIP69457.1 cell division protein FtsL [Chromatiales bacterium]